MQRAAALTNAHAARAWGRRWWARAALCSATSLAEQQAGPLAPPEPAVAPAMTFPLLYSCRDQQGERAEFLLRHLHLGSFVRRLPPAPHRPGSDHRAVPT